VLSPERQLILEKLLNDFDFQNNQKRDIIRLLNGILRIPDFYKEEYFSEIKLTDEVKALLNHRENNSLFDVARRNRRLLELASPGSIQECPEREQVDLKHVPSFPFDFICEINEDDVDFIIRWSGELRDYQRVNIYATIAGYFDRINRFFYDNCDLSRSLEIRSKIIELSRRYNNASKVVLFFLSAKAWLFNLTRPHRTQQKQYQIQAINEMEQWGAKIFENLYELWANIKNGPQVESLEGKILKHEILTTAERVGFYDDLLQLQMAIHRKVLELKVADQDYARHFHNGEPVQGKYFSQDVYLCCWGLVNALATSKWQNCVDRPKSKQGLNYGIISDVCSLMDLWDINCDFGMNGQNLGRWWRNQKGEHWRGGEIYKDLP
jgi:hypothetical protein